MKLYSKIAGTIMTWLKRILIKIRVWSWIREVRPTNPALRIQRDVVQRCANLHQVRKNNFGYSIRPSRSSIRLVVWLLEFIFLTFSNNIWVYVLKKRDKFIAIIIHRVRCFDFPKIENGIVEDRTRSYYFQVNHWNYVTICWYPFFLIPVNTVHSEN